MSVRAKFEVQKVERHNDSGEGTVTLWPVVGGSPENDSFYSATPAGEIKLSTLNKAALDQFEQGDQFYVDFTKAGE